MMLIFINIKYTFIRLYQKTNNITVLSPKRWNISDLHVHPCLSIRIPRWSKLFKPVSNHAKQMPSLRHTFQSPRKLSQIVLSLVLKLPISFAHCLCLYTPPVQTIYLLVYLFIVSFPYSVEISMITMPITVLGP